jgi:trigger factor
MDVKVEDLAACRKKLTITIPRETIDAKFEERYAELEKEAQVPGFRPGRAPRRLVEKRFHDAVGEEVRAKLVAEAYEKAIEEQKLQVLGEPDIDPDKLVLPDEGPMEFSVELEVRPEFTVPTNFSAIPLDAVKEPAVGDDDVAAALDRIREQHGRLEALGEGAEAAERDLVSGDLTLQAGDVMVLDRQNVRMPVAEVAIDGIRLEALPQLLKGAKAGETKSATLTIGQEADNEAVRGKEATLQVKVEKIERIVLPDDAALLAVTGYEDMEALRGALRRQLTNQGQQAYEEALETTIQDWLIEQCPFDLPSELAERHATRLLQRQVVNLQYRGVPVEEIEKRLGDIQGATTERAARDLRLHFILGALAKQEKVEVSDAEVDARIRFIAAQQSRKPDRVREDMARDGSLESLQGQIMEDKVLRNLLEKARAPKTDAPKTDAPKADAPAEDKPADAPPAEDKPADAGDAAKA